MRHISPNRIKGFTVIETLFVALTLGIIMSGLFYALLAGESPWFFTAAKIEVRSEVRRTVDWIARDVRQAVTWDIGDKNNNPLSTHIKFRKVTGYITTPGSEGVNLGNTIEYTYDSISETITRSDSGKPGQSWTFRYITQVPFKTRKSDGSIVVIDPENPGENSPMFNTGNLVIDLRGEKQVKTGLNTTYALVEEVRIRNGQ